MNNDRFMFRVWDAEAKQYDVGYLKLTQYGQLCLYHDGIMYDPYDGYIIEQCTGLRDKNGKLIFEGDVLQDGESVAEVVWSDDQYLLEYRDGYVGGFSLFAKLFEVVGNIHEGSWINE